jgi:predicted Zn-dependent protease
MSDSQMNHLGGETFSSILQKGKVIEDGVVVARVQAIGTRIVQSARSLYPSANIPREWEIVLIEDDTLNAFALPQSAAVSWSSYTRTGFPLHASIIIDD